MDTNERLIEHGERLATNEATYAHIIEKIDMVGKKISVFEESVDKRLIKIEEALSIGFFLLKYKRTVIGLFIGAVLFVLSQTGIDIDFIKSYFFK